MPTSTLTLSGIHQMIVKNEINGSSPDIDRSLSDF